MSSRSIVDRVLLFAAAICAAGLVWQLTVLVTTRNHAPEFRQIEAVSPAAAQTAATVSASAPAAPAEQVPTSSVRVVYPDVTTPKTTGKATEALGAAPVTLTLPSPMAFAPSVAPPPSAAPLASSIPAAAPPPPALAPSASASAVSGPQLSSPDGALGRAAAAGDAETASAASTVSAANGAAAAATPRSPEPVRVANLSPMAPAASTPVATASRAAPSTTTSRGLNINNASVEALNHLRGGGMIGQAIASHRPYRSVEDLVKKRVLRRNVYDQIRNQLAAQ